MSGFFVHGYSSLMADMMVMLRANQGEGEGEAIAINAISSDARVHKSWKHPMMGYIFSSEEF